MEFNLRRSSIIKLLIQLRTIIFVEVYEIENENKELDLASLERISGGTTAESKKLVEFLNKYYSDPESGKPLNIADILYENGIVCACTDNRAQNTYVDKDGYRIKHDELMRRLRQRVAER